jgi:hypothetical protein
LTLNVPFFCPFRHNNLRRNLIHTGLSIGIQLRNSSRGLVRCFSGEAFFYAAAIGGIGETRASLILR